MRFIQNNSIFKKGILGFVLLFVLLAPVSVSVVDTHLTPSIHISLQLTHADLSDDAVSMLGKGLSTLGGVTADVASWLLRPAANFFGNILLTTSAAVTYFGGTLLDLSLDQMVFRMGEKINGGTLSNAINTMWSLIRDICNLAFIFGFIFIGIRTIIEPDSASTKRFLSKIIIGALLINFSLFFVKIIIDFSNFTAYQIYIAMAPQNISIATAVTQLLGIVTIYTPGQEIIGKLFSDTSVWFYIFGSVFLVVTGFVFLAAAFLLISRFVALILIMVCSPILFAATVFPQTEQYASDLWSKLIGNAFYAPVYLLLVLISLTLLNGLNIKPASGAFTDMLKQADSATMVILNFIIVIFFMIAALTIANKTVTLGGKMVVSKTKTLIGASTAGLAAKAGRATFGKWAHEAAESDELKDRASQSGWRGAMARAQLKASRAVGDSTFDSRKIGGVGKANGFGEGEKGGYKTVLGNIKKKDEEFAKSLGEVGDTDVNVMARKKEMEATKQHTRHLQEKLKLEKDLEKREALSDEIEESKHHEHEAKVKYETEKQRRVLGSTFAEPGDGAVNSKLAEHKSNIAMQKDEINKAWGAYVKEKDEAKRQLMRKDIEQFNKELKESQDAYDTLFNQNTDRGYAGVLEGSTWYTAWPTGRLVTQERESGKAIRKARKDGLPKEKHDDHGGHGHGAGDDHEEDHGGGGHHAPAATHHPAPKPAASHAPAGGGNHGGGGHGHGQH